MSAQRIKVAVIAESSGQAASLVQALSAAGCEVEFHDPQMWPNGVAGPGADWIVLDQKLAGAMIAEWRLLRDELPRLRAELEERKLVERAKGLLMTRRGLTEPDAYRALQKMAMDRKRKLADIARNVLDFADLLGGPNDPTR